LKLALGRAITAVTLCSRGHQCEVRLLPCTALQHCFSEPSSAEIDQPNTATPPRLLGPKASGLSSSVELVLGHLKESPPNIVVATIVVAARAHRRRRLSSSVELVLRHLEEFAELTCRLRSQLVAAHGPSMH